MENCFQVLLWCIKNVRQFKFWFYLYIFQLLIFWFSLGYNPCDYMQSMCEFSQVWLDYINGNVPIESVIEEIEKSGYDCTQDVPWSLYWKELFQANGPETKVILTVRDSTEKWWTSFLKFFTQEIMRADFWGFNSMWVWVWSAQWVFLNVGYSVYVCIVMMYPRIVPLPNVTITELSITKLLYYGLLLPNTPHSVFLFYIFFRYLMTNLCKTGLAGSAMRRLTELGELILASSISK